MTTDPRQIVLEPTLARRKAREIIDLNPGATLVEVVALAYLEGRISVCQELKSTLEPRTGLHEYDCVTGQESP